MARTRCNYKNQKEKIATEKQKLNCNNEEIDSFSDKKVTNFNQNTEISDKNLSTEKEIENEINTNFNNKKEEKLKKKNTEKNNYNNKKIYNTKTKNKKNNYANFQNSKEFQNQKQEIFIDEVDSQENINKELIGKSKINDKNDQEEVDIEKILDGDQNISKIMIDEKGLIAAKNKYKAEVKAILTKRKNELLESVKYENNNNLKKLSPEVFNAPFASFLIGMKNRFSGSQIIANNKIDSYKKKPSVMITIGDETFVIDEKLAGVNDNKNKNPSLLNFINKVHAAYVQSYGTKRK
ncbi:hypothetical protein GVAV_002002 [Gurleya vavrai]